MKERKAVSWLLAAMLILSCGLLSACSTEPVIISSVAATGLNDSAAQACIIILNEGEEIERICGRIFKDPGFAAFNAAGERMDDYVTVKGEVLEWRVGDYELEYVLDNGKDLRCSVKRLVHIVPAELTETSEPEEKTIYLTFDDGPCENTPLILEILKKYDIKACFFVIASKPNFEEYIQLIAQEGHTIGIHCYEHNYSNLYYYSEDAYFTDFMRAQSLVYELTGDYARVVRFPGGTMTAKSLFRRYDDDLMTGYHIFEQKMHDLGVRIYDWDVQTENQDGSTFYTYLNFIKLIPEMNIRIVLQHDTRLYSINALEKMIVWALENGYSFKALDETVPEYSYYNRNGYK